MTVTLPSRHQELHGLPGGAIPEQRSAPPVRLLPAAPVRRRQRRPSAVSGVVAGLTVGAALVGAVGAAPAQASSAPASPPPNYTANVSVPGRVLTTFGDGTWQVGIDVAPGTYTTAATAGPGCHHALRAAVTGGDIVNGTVGRGAATVVLTEADGYFETSGCAPWRRVG